MVYIVNREQVSEEPLLIRDAKSTKVRYLIDQRHGANNFYLRIYEIGPGGQTPHDQHPYEHEVYVLRGRAKLLTMFNDVPTLRDVSRRRMSSSSPRTKSINSRTRMRRPSRCSV